MNPKKEIEFDELQLKLGIKSSLPNVKAALALLLAMWESGIHEDNFVYGNENGDKIEPVELVVEKLSAYFSCDSKQLLAKIKTNPLYTSQMEALQVGFELGWRLAKFTFVDETFPFSKERTGGKRYAKKISFTKNIDIVSLFIKQDDNNKTVLYHWIMQTPVPTDLVAKESGLKQLLTALSEECVFRIRTNDDGTYTFRNYGIYDALLEEDEVSTTDAKEQVGTLRILNSIINDGLNYYFVKQPNGTVKLRDGIDREELERYSTRVQNFLSLSDVRMSFTETPIEDQPEELTPEWFRTQAATMATVDQEADTLYKEFQAYFAPSILKQLSDRELLDKFFLSDHKDEHNLCYTLEHDPRYQIFGGIKGGSSYKYGLFYSKDHTSWVTGSPKKVRKLTESDAIELGTSIRDELVAGAEVIANYGELNDLNDYADLYAQVFKVMPSLINKMWVMKYLHMMFPEIFPVFYNGEWQNRVLNQLSIEPKEDSFIRMGQIALFVKKCGISNVAFSKVIYKLKADPNSDVEDETEEEPPIPTYTFDTAKGGAQNRVVYGTPGCGKSYYVQNTYLAKCGVAKDHRIRTTFYMDYTNTDFVGQILPKVKPSGEVTYDFNPGPFALALKTAIENPDVAVALIIEELNRGNAASIFGDIFQLLDRDAKGKSQYSITNVNLQDYLNKCFEGVYTFNSISIPANLYIVATMNTSDQNVFTLDTAFKRRWQFEKLRNEFTLEHEYKDYFVPGMDGVTWETLVTAINKYIVDRPDDLASEDKQLGVYFIEKGTLCATAEECSDETKINRFAFKLFEYLWDDVAKYAHSDWFAAEIKTLDDLIDGYKRLGVKVFADGVLDV